MHQTAWLFSLKERVTDLGVHGAMLTMQNDTVKQDTGTPAEPVGLVMPCPC